MLSNDSKDIPEFCYLQVSIAGQVQPKPIVIQLHKETCPKTCRNFVALCTNDDGEASTITSPQKPIATYRGCRFHRIVPNFMCQAGDFERFDGTGGYSPIYHGGRFNDENLKGRHDREGVVSMANAGKNTNKSQFFITLKATPHLDGKHVVFGQVVSGMEGVHAMATVELEGDRPVPLQRIVISDCGIGKGDQQKDDKNRKGSLKRVREEKDDSDRKRSKKKHKKRSKSKHRYHDNDDDGSRHRDRKKGKKRRRHSRKDEDSDSYSDSSSSFSPDDDSRDGDRSRHRRKHRSKSEERHGRRKHSSSSHGEKSRSRSSKRKKRRSHRSSDSSSSAAGHKSHSSNGDEDRQSDRRKHKHKSRR
mmetsp:Transcript_934/g.1825  ORF Transcript_934/g.1825 Transcript_934/m.1825 type:complete len:361 (+) Transcript_934:287-1369(+)